MSLWWVALLVASASVDVEPQVGLWMEQDSNPRRLPEADADLSLPDGLLRFSASLGLKADAPGRILRLDAAVGGKLFFAASSERMLVAQTRALAAAAFGDGWTLVSSASTKLRGQLSGQRSYGASRADLSVEHDLVPGLSVQGGLEGSSFFAFDNPGFSFGGGGGVLGARLGADKERLDVVVDAGLRGFPFASPASDPAVRRVDWPLMLGLTATSARRLYLQAGYTLVHNQSNALAEGYTRHRLQVAAGTLLPASVTVTAQLAVQLTNYDQGASAGQAYFVADDDETQNLAEVTLQRRLLGGLSVEARLGFLSNELASDSAHFSRATAALGLRADL